MSNPNKDQVDFANLIKNKFTMRKDIAPVEDSSTASRAYSAGDLFYYGNLLQRATQDIAQGAGFAAGVNFENADPLGSQFGNIANYCANNGVKNLNAMPYTLPTNYTWKGITWKVNSDGTVNVSGTATEDSEIQLHQRVITSSNPLYLKFGKYKFSCQGVVADTIDARIATTKNNAYSLICNAPANGSAEFILSNTTSDYVSDGKVLVAVYLRVGSGKTVNTTLYPMICDASISTDNTYEPYAKTNQQLTKETTGLIDNTTQLGCVNQLSLDLAAIKSLNIGGSWSSNVYTQNDISFTVNDEKTINTTFSGTASETFFQLLGSFTIDKPMLLTGCPSGGDYWKHCLFTKSGGTYYNDMGEGVLLPAGTYDYLKISIRNQATSPVLFKPMLSVPSMNLSYNDYVPYAKSNRELTEDVSYESMNILSQISSSKATISYATLYKVGTVKFLRIEFEITTAVSAWESFISLPNIAKPTVNTIQGLWTYSDKNIYISSFGISASTALAVGFKSGITTIIYF